MSHDFRSFTFRGCGYGQFPATEAAISASVGQGGVNRRDDVQSIQTMLNQVPAADGGPRPRLAVDRIVGPLTIAAIRSFQTRHLGWADGRVDPGGPTIARLRGFGAALGAGGTNALAAPGKKHRHAPSPPRTEAIRRASAIAVLPSGRSALQKAQLELDLVSLRLTKEVLHIKDLFHGEGPEQRPWRVFDRHFALSGLSTAA